MTQIIKVLIADDSFFMRKILRRFLEGAGGFDIVGEAKDGREAVFLAKQLKPDVITMDCNMPFLTGAMATNVIMSEVRPAPSIVMLSAFTKKGTEETLECLRSGAVDFVCKPSGELSLDLEKVGAELLQKIRNAARAHARMMPIIAPKEKHEPYEMNDLPKKIKIPDWLVVIGASTGGPPVIEEILACMPNDIPVAFLVVQHMPPYFTKSFAKRLNKMTDLSVLEASNGTVVSEGSVLVAPGDFHMTLERENGQFVIKLNQGSLHEGMRPSIDILFASVANVWEGKLIAVELTGMGIDGSHNMKQLKKNGGFIIAQNLETAVVESMPESIIKQGIADAILTPIEIAEKIITLTK